MKREMSPLRREIAVSELPRGGIEIEIEANARERADIARRFDLLGVEALAGIYHVDPIARGVRVTGEVVARIRQTCVVSLDAFELALREPVLLTFGTDADAGRIGAGQVEISPEEEDLARAAPRRENRPRRRDPRISRARARSLSAQAWSEVRA